MKKKKSTLVFALFLLSALFLNGSILLAQPEIEDAVPTFSWDEYLAWMLPERGTNEYINRILVKNMEMAELKALNSSSVTRFAQDATAQVAIPKYTQENEFYCVPAACQNIIYSIKRSSPSQQNLARNMHTGTYFGTSASAAAAELRKQTGINYQVGIIDEQNFYNHIKTNIDAGRPVMLLIRYSAYKPGEADFGHALIAYAYDDNYDTVLCFDVLDGSYRWDTLDTIREAAFFYIY